MSFGASGGTTTAFDYTVGQTRPKALVLAATQDILGFLGGLWP